MANVNIAVPTELRDTLKELIWEERATGQNPLTLAEQVAKILAFYQANKNKR